MAEHHEPQGKVLAAVRRLLDQIVRRHPDVQELVDQIDRLLAGEPPAASRPTQRRTGEGVQYEVRSVNKLAMLYEIRPAGAPLRIGRDVYDATVDVLATAGKPLNYDEITEGVEARICASLGDWQGRTVLRFIQSADPPIVIRSRSRYRAVDPSKFAAAARRLWTSTAKA